MALRVCSSCARHVRTTDSVCPFCAVEQSVTSGAPASAAFFGTRATMLFGATAVLAACGSSVSLYGAPGPDIDRSADAGGDTSMVAVYGAPGPAPDASSDAGASASSDADADATNPDGGAVPPYGAPDPGK